jgi:hypothetical protein
MGTCQLVWKVVVTCQYAYASLARHFSLGYFANFHVFALSSVSRVWALGKYILQVWTSCYENIHSYLIQRLGTLSEMYPKDVNSFLDLSSILNYQVTPSHTQDKLLEKLEYSDDIGQSIGSSQRKMLTRDPEGNKGNTSINTSQDKKCKEDRRVDVTLPLLTTASNICDKKFLGNLELKDSRKTVSKSIIKTKKKKKKKDIPISLRAAIKYINLALQEAHNFKKASHLCFIRKHLQARLKEKHEPKKKEVKHKGNQFRVNENDTELIDIL